MRTGNNILPKSKIAYIMSSLMLLTSSVTAPVMNVHAAESNIQMQLNTLSISLRHIIENRQDVLIEEIKTQISENGWDYGLTMDSIDTSEVFKTVDYVDMLAAYMTAKEYSRLNHTDFTYIEDIPLIEYTAEEKTIEEKIPLKIPNFIESDDGTGTYEQKGNIYITDNTRIDTYEEIGDGIYKKAGYKDIILDTREVTYADISFEAMTAEKLLAEYDLTEDEFQVYQKRIKKLTQTTDRNTMYQSIFGRVPQGYTYDGNTELLSETKQRRLVVSTAATLIGMIPYQWGGKPTKPGYDRSWWQFDSDNNQKGLDCSGFIQWVYMTAGYNPELYSQMTTVANMSQTLTEISKEELRPGDIGAWFGPITNHVGIYAGDNKWIHCTGGTTRTVVIDDFNFTKFFRAIDDNEDNYINEDIDSYELVYANILDDTTEYSNEDILLLASLVQHEAGSEGINGWIGVAEVVKNRVRSDLYPNTIPEVIFQPGQFTTAKDLQGSPPSEAIIQTVQMVLSGQMAILNEPSVMYFRNPMITDGIPATEQVDWGKNKYFTAVGHHAFYSQG